MDKNIIFNHDGKITQEIIANNIEILEKSIENMGIMGKIATVTVELSQNMMTYSKSKDINCSEIVSEGSLEISKEDDTYFIKSKNIINLEDKIRIEPKLQEIKLLDSSGIKKKYKELRKSGENAHDNNGGIGFLEIAKQCTIFDYEFETINEERFYFILKTTVAPKKR